MFNIFKKKSAGQKVVIQLSGLHCTSCSLSIDGELEELKGVISSNTSYARQQSTVIYDPKLVDQAAINTIIEKLGYTVVR